MTAEEWDANASTLGDRMTPEEAVRIDAIMAKEGELIDLLECAWNREDDITLGYESWREYVISEFGHDPKAVPLMDASLGVHHYRQDHGRAVEFDAYLQAMGVPEPTAAGFRTMARIGEILERTLTSARSSGSAVSSSIRQSRSRRR